MAFILFYCTWNHSLTRISHSIFSGYSLLWQVITLFSPLPPVSMSPIRSRLPSLNSSRGSGWVLKVLLGHVWSLKQKRIFLYIFPLKMYLARVIMNLYSALQNNFALNFHKVNSRIIGAYVSLVIHTEYTVRFWSQNIFGGAQTTDWPLYLYIWWATTQSQST